MEDQPSKLWNVALVFSLLILAAVCYIKIDPVRTFVDEKCPWIKEQLASHGIQLPGGAALAQATPAAAPATQVSSANMAPVSAVPAPAAAAAPKSTPAPVKVAQPPLDMARLASDQSLWPKRVRLKKDVTFPAVMNKQKVGELHISAGTEVLLIQIRADNKLGVAYTPTGSMDNAGGAVISPDDTDVLERANAGR